MLISHLRIQFDITSEKRTTPPCEKFPGIFPGFASEFLKVSGIEVTFQISMSFPAFQ